MCGLNLYGNIFSILLSYRLNDFCLICSSTVNCLLFANNYSLYLQVYSYITIIPVRILAYNTMFICV